MREFPFKKFDAFAVGASSGNPAGCVYLEDETSISIQEMQQIAKELKGFVNEVGYLSPDEEGFRLRFFSSECEVELCGHATIAIMYDLIANDPGYKMKKQLSIGVKAGRLSVFNHIDEENAVYIMAPPPQYLPCSLTPDNVSEALKMDIGGIKRDYPIQLVNGGLRTLIVPLTSLGFCLEVAPEQEKLRRFCAEQDIDIILVFCKDTYLSSSHYRTRVFAPKYGYLEDPATGSGNSAFGYYLKELDQWFDPITIEQGSSEESPNIIRLRGYQDGQDFHILFGGSAVVRIDGSYMLHEEL